ncbi:head-tail adaptor protein [Tardiphaga sp.]|uniref:head-tail adaptor protein n=1 Tax=Tardiphaga sp. TaxID=1926292 RepID=UPI0025D3D718|nr:head-tail adaptor protein [Tardiphaga sp.]
MTDPGRLKTRLTLQAPVEAADGQGGVTRDYVAQQVVWAAVMPRAGRRDVEADADGARVRLRIIMRAGIVLTPRHRLLDGARIYRIVSWREIDDRRFIEIEAEGVE